MTALVGEQVRSLNQAKHRQFKQGLVGDVVDSIAAKLQIDQAVLSSVVGLFRASSEVSRDEFSEFYRALVADNLYLEGIAGVGFSRILSPSQLPEFERLMQSEGFSGLRCH